MKEFKIEYKYLQEEELRENWKKYPKEPVYYTEVTDANIYFYVKDKLLKNPKRIATTTDWILDYCIRLSRAVIELKYREKVVVDGSDNPLRIEIETTNSNWIFIRFSITFNHEEKISYNGFAEGVLELLGKFLKDVDSINPELYKIDAFKKIKENREKIRQILKKLNEK